MGTLQRIAGRAWGPLAGLGLSAALAAGSVLAQTASQITPPTLAPEQPRLQGEVIFSGQPGLEAPAGAERLSVTISEVVIEGALPELEAANRAVERRLEGRPVPVSAIFTAAQDLEAAYAQAGFVLTRVVLPAQTLRDGGPLRLVVVHGFIERADLGAVPAPVRPRIESVTRPLIGRPDLRLGEIERRLLIAGDTPGVALNTALAAGTRPGGTILTFGADYRPLTGYIGADNTLSDELGDWAISVGLEANGYFNLGEVIYARAAANPHSGSDELGGVFDQHPRMRSVAGGFLVPLGTNGLTFNLEAVRSNTTPELAGDIQTTSEFQRLSFRLHYPWIRSRMFDVDTDVIFDIQSEDLDLVTDEGDLIPLSEDDLRILRLALGSRRQLDSGAIVQGRAVASFGLDILNARTADDASPTLPLSREGADAEFGKLEIGASYARRVSEHLAFVGYARGQTSFGEPLLRSEQIGLASFRELSTFDAGTLGGDSGWVVRGDVLSPWTVTTPWLPFAQVTPYGFAAAGALYLEESSALEEDSLRVASVGFGVELSTVLDPGFSNAALTMEFGRAFRDDDLSDENRFTMVGSFRF